MTDLTKDLRESYAPDGCGRCDEAADEIDRLRTALAAETERVRVLTEALRPTGETKAEYIGEFKFPIVEWVEDEETEEMVERTRDVMVPWDTIKEIMAAIRDRAARASAPSHEPDAAKVERVRILTEALTLAANRLDRLMLECPQGSAIRLNAYEWVTEARAALTAAQEQT